MTAPLSADRETLRRVLLEHHPIAHTMTGPLKGCRCGQVGLGQDVIAHVAEQVAAYRATQDGGAEEAVRRVEALAEQFAEAPHDHGIGDGHASCAACWVADLRAALAAGDPS